MKVVYGRREIFKNKRYEELGVISIYEVRDRRNTDERARRSGIKIEKNWTENRALWNRSSLLSEGFLTVG